MIIYLNKFVSENLAAVSYLDRGFLFADGVYEFIRTYNRNLYRFNEHYLRLVYSSTALDLKAPDKDVLLNIINELVERNGLFNDEYFVYIQITRGAAAIRKHQFPEAGIAHTLLVTVSPLKVDRKENTEGIAAILHEDIRWLRCDIKSISLLANVLAKQKAVSVGAVEALMTRDGSVLEGSHSNLFIVKEERIITPPLSNFVLKGITREVVVELCMHNSLQVKEETVIIDDLLSASEIFITGTSTEIKPVVKINGMNVGSGKPGIITRRLQELFYDLVGGYR